MKLKEFKEEVNDWIDEIGVYGEEGHIASHKIEGDVYLSDDDGNFYSIIGFDADRLPGYGCARSLVVRIKQDKE